MTESDERSISMDEDHASTESTDDEDSEPHGREQSGLYGSEETTSCSQNFGQFPYMRLKQRVERVQDDAIIPRVERHHRSPALWFPVKHHDRSSERSPEARARTNVLPAIKHRRDSPAGANVCFGKPPAGKPRTRPLDDSNKCHTCGKEFSTMAQLYWHLLMHAGERSNTCHQCGKVFSSRKARKRHMLQHTHEYEEASDGEVRERRADREEADESTTTTLVESQTECSIVFVEGENFEKHVYLDNPWGSESGLETPASRERSEQDGCSYSPDLRSGECFENHLHAERGNDHAYAYCSPGLELQYQGPLVADLDVDTCMESPLDELGDLEARRGDYENEVQLVLSSLEDDPEQSPFHGNSPSNGYIDEVFREDLHSGEELQGILVMGDVVGDEYVGWSSQAEESSDYLTTFVDHEPAPGETGLDASFTDNLKTGQCRSGEEGPDDVDSHGQNDEPTLLDLSLEKEPRDDLSPNENHNGSTQEVSTPKCDEDHYSEQGGTSSSSSKTSSPKNLAEGTNLHKYSHNQEPFGGQVRDYRRDDFTGGVLSEDGVPEVSSEAEHDACPVCGRFFTSRARLSAHVLLHGAGRALRCRRLPTSLASEHARSRHMTAHMPASGPKYKSSDPPLRRRVQKNDAPRWYKCCVCHSTFPFRSHARRHLMIHTDEGPYKCRNCRKSSANTGSLTSHVRLHLGERQYQCSLRGKSFCTSARLPKHLSSRKCE